MHRGIEAEPLDRGWWKERVLLSAAVISLYVLYFPVGSWSLAMEGNHPDIALDHAIPFIPGWIHVYVMIYAAAMLPVAVVRHRDYFRRVALAYFLVEATALALFLIYPVHMALRPEITQVDSFITWGLKLCFSNDTPSNCLPSLHVADALLGALSIWRINRRVGVFALTLAFLIAVSTVLVKQHYLADVFAGFLLAGAGYRLIVRPFPLEGIRDVDLCFPLKGVLGVGLAHFTLIVGCYIAYLAGWEPW